MVLRQTARTMTHFGGLSVFIEFLRRIGNGRQVMESLPVHLQSPNAIPAEEMFIASLMAVRARRLAHTALLRADQALHALPGMELFPTDDTIRNLFKRFRQSMVVQFYEPLWAWQFVGGPKCVGGYSPDLDSTCSGTILGYPVSAKVRPPFLGAVFLAKRVMSRSDSLFPILVRNPA